MFHLTIALALHLGAEMPATAPACAGGYPADRAALVDLAEIEEEAGVPESRRGILAAVWCVEWRWRPAGKPGPRGDRGRAVGPMQLHAENAMRCGADHRLFNTPDDPRLDLAFSGRCWLQRVGELMRKRALERCPGSAWDVAEAMVSSPFYRWRCSARTSHVELLERWQAQEAERAALP